MNNHNIKDLDLLYADAKKLINEIALEKIDGIVLRSIETAINNIEEYWHGKDAVIQINKLVDVNNLVIDNYNVLGNVGVFISMLAKNYRDAQNANGEVLPSFLQLSFTQIAKKQKVDNKLTELYMHKDLSNVVSSLSNLNGSLEEINSSVLTIRTSIMNNWIGEDENRNNAIKMFENFSNNTSTITNNIKEIVNCINTSIENYNASLGGIEAIPSLESMVNENNLMSKNTEEEQRVLNSIERNFKVNKDVSNKFNKILFSEAKKDLDDKGVL